MARYLCDELVQRTGLARWCVAGSSACVLTARASSCHVLPIRQRSRRRASTVPMLSASGTLLRLKLHHVECNQPARDVAGANGCGTRPSSHKEPRSSASVGGRVVLKSTFRPAARLTPSTQRSSTRSCRGHRVSVCQPNMSRWSARPAPVHPRRDDDSSAPPMHPQA